MFFFLPSVYIISSNADSFLSFASSKIGEIKLYFSAKFVIYWLIKEDKCAEIHFDSSESIIDWSMANSTEWKRAKILRQSIARRDFTNDLGEFAGRIIQSQVNRETFFCQNNVKASEMYKKINGCGGFLHWREEIKYKIDEIQLNSVKFFDRWWDFFMFDSLTAERSKEEKQNKTQPLRGNAEISFEFSSLAFFATSLWSRIFIGCDLFTSHVVRKIYHGLGSIWLEF